MAAVTITASNARPKADIVSL